MDVAILSLPDNTPPTGVNTRVLARDRLVAVVSTEHPLAGRRRLRLEDLADEAFVDSPREPLAGCPPTSRSRLPPNEGEPPDQSRTHGS